MRFYQKTVTTKPFAFAMLMAFVAAAAVGSATFTLPSDNVPCASVPFEELRVTNNGLQCCNEYPDCFKGDVSDTFRWCEIATDVNSCCALDSNSVVTCRNAATSTLSGNCYTTAARHLCVNYPTIKAILDEIDTHLTTKGVAVATEIASLSTLDFTNPAENWVVNILSSINALHDTDNEKSKIVLRYATTSRRQRRDTALADLECSEAGEDIVTAAQNDNTMVEILASRTGYDLGIFFCPCQTSDGQEFGLPPSSADVEYAMHGTCFTKAAVDDGGGDNTGGTFSSDVLDALDVPLRINLFDTFIEKETIFIRNSRAPWPDDTEGPASEFFCEYATTDAPCVSYTSIYSPRSFDVWTVPADHCNQDDFIAYVSTPENGINMMRQPALCPSAEYDYDLNAAIFQQRRGLYTGSTLETAYTTVFYPTASVNDLLPAGSTDLCDLSTTDNAVFGHGTSGTNTMFVYNVDVPAKLAASDVGIDTNRPALQGFTLCNAANPPSNTGDESYQAFYEADPDWTWKTSYDSVGNPKKYESTFSGSASICGSSTPQTPWCTETGCSSDSTTADAIRCSNFGGHFYEPFVQVGSVHLKTVDSVAALVFENTPSPDDTCDLSVADFLCCKYDAVTSSTICTEKDAQGFCDHVSSSFIPCLRQGQKYNAATGEWHLFQVFPDIRRAEFSFCFPGSYGFDVPDIFSYCYDDLDVESPLYSQLSTNRQPNTYHWFWRDNDNCLSVTVADKIVYLCDGAPTRHLWAQMIFEHASSEFDVIKPNVENAFRASLLLLEPISREFQKAEVDIGTRWIDHVLRKLNPGEEAQVKFSFRSTKRTRRSRRSIPPEDTCDRGTVVSSEPHDGLPNARTPDIEVTGWLCDCENDLPCYSMAALTNNGGGDNTNPGGGTDTTTDSGDDSLSDGAIAGIVVGSLAGVVLLVVAVPAVAGALGGSSAAAAAGIPESVPLKTPNGAALYV